MRVGTTTCSSSIREKRWDWFRGQNRASRGRWNQFRVIIEQRIQQFPPAAAIEWRRRSGSIGSF